MPCIWEIRAEERLVIVRAHGVFTFADVMNTRLQFTSHPAFDPEFFQLYDFREVTDAAITTEEIRESAKAAVFSAVSRRALVAPRADFYGLSRMFAAYREAYAGLEVIEVFRTIEDAERWLEGQRSQPVSRTSG